MRAELNEKYSVQFLKRTDIIEIATKALKHIVRDTIAKDGIRPDGRKPDESADHL